MDPLEPFISSSTFPRSTSASSLQSIDPSTPASTSAGAAPKPSGFIFNSLSSVWSGLKAAAGVEVAGFLKAVHGGGPVDETAHAGDKRARLGNDEGQGNGSGKTRMEKRRKVNVQEDLLFDQVPPLMTPISQARPVATAYELSSSPVAYLSSSPEATRNHLRPYANPSYADELMYGDFTEASSSSALPPSRRSVDQGGVRSLSGRRKLSVQGVPTAIDTATTTATANTTATTRHARSQSQAQGRDRAQAHHVHFAFPSSSSLPNLAAVANKSMTTPKKGKDNGKGKEKEQVGNILLGESGGRVSRAWKEAKEEEKRASDKRKIEQLESEVKRLKGELSTRSPAPLPLPPRSPFKSRRSAPPPPPPPPPPPVGHPLSSVPRNAHPVLFTARASLKATPPRPKRRASAIGGAEGGSAMDMEAFLDELGAKRGKLRKVGLPKEKSAEDLRREKGGAAEMSEVLQRAFARKFARANGLSSPSFSHTTPFASSKASSSLHPPDWSSPHTSFLTSRSHPTNLSSLGRSVSPAPVPSQPVFHSAGQSSLQVPSTSAATGRLPRSTSLNASIETTTVFGQALSTDDAVFTTPSSSSHSRPLYHPAQQPISAALSPSLSASSLPSAPPEPTPISSLPPLHHQPSISPDCSPPQPSADSTAASARLSAARRRSNDGQPLPGLELGTKRPVTPGRGKKRLSKGAAGESSPLVGAGSPVVGTPVPRSSGSSRTERKDKGLQDLGAATDGDGEPEDQVVLVATRAVSSASAATPVRKKEGLGHRRTRSQAEKERRETSVLDGRSGSDVQLGVEEDIEEPAWETEELVASRTRAPEPGRVFGRA
ncbi:hypothetical protein JCM5296_000974 [Sporobolomyces johnsonii]